jgi:hypothetical protein
MTSPHEFWDQVTITINKEENMNLIVALSKEIDECDCVTSQIAMQDAMNQLLAQYEYFLNTKVVNIPISFDSEQRYLMLSMLSARIIQLGDAGKLARVYKKLDRIEESRRNEMRFDNE